MASHLISFSSLCGAGLMPDSEFSRPRLFERHAPMAGQKLPGLQGYPPCLLCRVADEEHAHSVAIGDCHRGRNLVHAFGDAYGGRASVPAGVFQRYEDNRMRVG
jgi:hypothetical protein